MNAKSSNSCPTAIVFGASGGIGSAVTDSFIRRGCTVYAIDTLPKQRRDGVVYFDARPTNSKHEVFAHLKQTCASQPAHVCVCIAGAMTHEVALGEEALSAGNETLLSETVHANFIETISITTSMISILAGGSSITLTSSINASGDFGFPFYSAAKAAIEGFVRSSARPLGRRGIRINAVSFGTVRTQRSNELFQVDEAHFERLRQLAATTRLTTLEEAGTAMTSLALDLTNVTGVILACDGGQSIPGNHTFR